MVHDKRRRYAGKGINEMKCSKCNTPLVKGRCLACVVDVVREAHSPVPSDLISLLNCPVTAEPLRDIVVFLFTKNTTAAKPWLDAGYECWLLDNQHPEAYSNGGITEVGDKLRLVHADLTRVWLPPFDKRRIAFVFAFPPCDHLAVSGSRWFKGKGLRLLARSIDMFATAAEFCTWSGADYLIENPVSNIASHWRKSDYRCHPHHFTRYCEDDNYTKLTCLWVSDGFIMPEIAEAEGLGEPDDRIHKAAPGSGRKDFRSATPLGFAKAVFEANRKQLLLKAI